MKVMLNEEERQFSSFQIMSRVIYGVVLKVFEKIVSVLILLHKD